MSQLGLKTLLFDFDGTLMDSSEAICLSFNTSLHRHGHPMISKERIKRMIGIPLVEMFRQVAPEGRRQSLVDCYRDLFNSNAVALSKLIPTVADSLQLLARTKKMAIVTSRSARGALHLLRHFHLEELFPVVVGIEHVARGKPDPEAVKLALELLGSDSRTTALIGDTNMDMEAALAADVLPIGVTTGVASRRELFAAGAREVFDSMAELAERIGEADDY